MSLPAADTSAWLVATKLQPPLVRSERLPRPDLEAALARSVSTLPLTLLSAPAGYGKTTMLAALPQLLPGLPLAWVTLDAEDNDPVRFLGLLTSALQRLHPQCGSSVWPLIAGGAGGGADLRRATGALSNDMLACLPEPFILVLDDLHTVTEPAVHITLEYLLEHQPPQLHLAVGTRHDPPLRLARLAARRQLGELRRPDLCFSAHEADQLLNGTLGLSLSESDLSVLQARTEGWPAGLCLAAGSLGRLGNTADRSQFMAAISSSERYALDFLTEEVLRNVPDDLRRFLLQTSILTEMTPSLCRAVTERADAAEVLDGLYRQNLTIALLAPAADGEPVYRHHALFARLLTRQLERELPGEIPQLHQRAAGACTTPGRAIAHYLAAGLWSDAARLMARSGMVLLHSGMSDTVRSWIGALPPAVAAADPHLTLLLGACEIHRGDFAAAAERFRQSRAGFAAAGDAAGEGEAASALITIAMQKNDMAAAAAEVKDALKLPLSPMSRMRVLLTDAWLQVPVGNWAAIEQDVAEALAIPGTTGNRQADLVGITFMNAVIAAVPGCMELTQRYCAEAGAVAPPETAWRLGADELSIWPLIWQGRSDEALARAEAAEALRQRLGGFPFVGNDLPAQLTVLYLARGDREAAGRAVETLLQRLPNAARMRRSFYLHAAGRALALLGRQAEAESLLQRLTQEGDTLPLTQYLCDHLAGLLALLQGRHAEAAAILERAAKREAELPIAYIGGSARLLQARWLAEQGRTQAARTAVAAVISEWERAGIPGCALLDGPAVQPALNPDSAAAPAVSGLAALPEPLTEREIDVLRLIAAGRTNPQIGEALYITVETVKTHVAHILRKLDVTSRTQAATRGRELGL